MPATKKKKIILGIDPGLADTGYGLINKSPDRLNALSFGSIKTDKNLPLDCRLLILYQTLQKIIQKYRPDCLAVEHIFFQKNAKTAFLVGQARGVVLLAAAQNKLPIMEFTPLVIKQSVTGYGRADKRQVQQMVKVILKLKTIPRPDDAADALAAAICASSHRL